MMMRIATYKEVRPLMLPGDIMGFGGYGSGSMVIKKVTKSDVSHLGMVFNTSVVNGAECSDKIIVELSEANQRYTDPVTGNTFVGVHRSRLSARIEGYDGDVWWFPLSDEVRERFNAQAFTNYILSAEKAKIPYDLTQAISSWSGMNEEDLTELFCSEYTSAAHEMAGVFPNGINCSRTTPIDHLKYRIFKDDYYQLKAKDNPIHIDEFNEIIVT
jgi:hypothetical protein